MELRRGRHDRPAGAGVDPPAEARVDPDRVSRAADEPADDKGARAGRRDGVRHGGDPAHLARAVDGRALLPEQRRRLSLGAARGRGERAFLPDADDRRGHDPARQGARTRRRRRGPAGARHGQTSGRAHDRVRRAPRGRRAGAVTRRAVARPGAGGKRRGRLRARAHRGGARSPAAGAHGRDQRLRRRHHDRARARAAPRLAWSRRRPSRA